MRVLFVTPAISWPLRFGADIRRWNILQALRAAGEVDALVFRRNDDPLSDQAFAGCRTVFGCSPLHLALSASDSRLYQTAWGRGWLALSRARPFELLGNSDAAGLPPGAGVPFGDYDLVWSCTANVACRIAVPPHVPTILDGDDFSYVRNWHLLRNSPWYGAKAWNYLNVAKLWWLERKLHRSHTAVVRCSQEDQQRHPARNVHVIPNGATIPAAIRRHPGRIVLFVGDLGYEPNAQGLEWFISSTWPLIRAAAPDASLRIAGRLPTPYIQAAAGRDGTSVLGFVDDLAPLYAEAACSIAPLLAGGGTRLKILESLAFETPVVATTLGAFGIPAGESEGLARADDPEDFARLCVDRLLHTSAHHLQASAGRLFVQRNYDWTVIRQQVTELAMQVGA